MIRTTGRLAPCLVAAALLAACGAKTRPRVTTAPVPPAETVALPVAPAMPASAADTAPARPRPAAAPTEEEIFARKTLAELAAERPLGDVFFALDADALRDPDRRVLQENGVFLRRWPSVQAIIQGHCDSRGSAEYNFALGDRRATAVSRYLVELGVRPGQIRTVSLGKEQPFCSGEYEGCWQENRRGHPRLDPQPAGRPAARHHGDEARVPAVPDRDRRRAPRPNCGR